MRNIEIGRYGADEAKDLRTGRGFSGWISGEDNDGHGWIMWMDENGRPCVYFGNREPSGAVIDGSRIHLTEPPTAHLCSA